MPTVAISGEDKRRDASILSGETSGPDIDQRIGSNVEQNSATSLTLEAKDSGTLYRLSGSGPVVTLPPTAGCVIGRTVFYLQCLGTDITLVTDPDSLNDAIEAVGTDFNGIESTGVTIIAYALAEVRYLGTNRWTVCNTFVRP